VVQRTGSEIKWNQHRDIWYEDLMKVAGSVCAPKEMGAEEALFILYTSGSTGKPKGGAAHHRWLPGIRLADP
jgi:acetyl-CoA synthetase